MAEERGPLSRTGEVLSTRRLGEHRLLTLALPGVATRARPGHFLAVAVGPEHWPVALARRPLWIHRVQHGGPHGDTVDVVVRPVGAGTRWLAGLREGARVDVIAPLGRPFTLPRSVTSCLLLADGTAAAAVLPLAGRLRERGCSVELVLAAEREGLLLPTHEVRRSVRRVTVLTADGSAGSRGTLADQAAGLVVASGARVVYAAGPASSLAAVARACEAGGRSAQLGLEQPMPCGTGLCHGCPVPVRGEDGVDREVRACLEGPVLRADRVRWRDL